MKNDYSSLQNIPVGINKETLEIEKINVVENNFYIITGEDIFSNTQFITTWINFLPTSNQATCMVIDNSNLLNKNEVTNATYETGENILTALETLNSNANTMKICVIIGLGTILKKLGITEKEKIASILAHSTNIKYVIVDTIDNIKTLSYEVWFKGNASLSEGIWLGNGIANQFTLKVTTNSRILRAELDQNFGYVIKKGKATLVKFVSEE